MSNSCFRLNTQRRAKAVSEVEEINCNVEKESENVCKKRHVSDNN
ncbi:hypothetical protein PUN28_005914 [Cardiocondyla obscurior]|uniref:Uncharacterized protein n=1 Tax=Cardiocondyla obscurior TaxID=286306 RepID=A0AAW2G8Q6_9HYME